MQNIIIVGTGGRLGAAIARRWRDRYRVLAYDRRAMDLGNPAQIEDHLQAVKFDTLINCAALTSLEACEKEPAQAAAINTHAPALMAKICQEKGARMIQISTDYVYEGSDPALKTESSPISPLGQYATTKAAGEAAVLAANPTALVARVSWIFGPDRPSFVDQILERSKKHDDVTAIADKFSAPSYSHDIADFLESLLVAECAPGIYNACNGGSVSWREYGQAALDIARQLGWKLRTKQLGAQSLSDAPGFLCPRPRFTAMSTQKFTAATGITPRTWRDALHDYLATYYAT